VDKLGDFERKREMADKQSIVRLKIPSVKDQRRLAGILWNAGYKIRCEPCKVTRWEGESRLCLLLTTEQMTEQTFAPSGAIIRLKIPNQKDQRALAELLFDNRYTLWWEKSGNDLRFCIGLAADQLAEQSI